MFIKEFIQQLKNLWPLIAVGGIGLAALGAESPQPDTYQTKGVVRSVKTNENSVVIAHEEIPGYMEAMTMPFSVKDPQELAGIKPGDTITFRVNVLETEGWIDRLVKVDNILTNTVSPSQETFHISPMVEELKVGDKLPNYTFTNEFNKVVSLEQFRGKAVAFTFIFTRCPFPDFCPRLNNYFSEAARLLSMRPNGPYNWHLLSISFDIKRDTPAVLLDYARKFRYDPSSWSFLTSDLITVESLGEHFGLTFWKEGESISHNMRTVVLNPEGRVHHIFIGNKWKPSELAAEMLEAMGVK